jgi:hypothetical protein
MNRRIRALLIIVAFAALSALSWGTSIASAAPIDPPLCYGGVCSGLFE